MSDQLPVLKVKPWAPSQGEFVHINEADFDPDVHELFDTPTDAQPATEPKRKKGRA